MSPASAASVPGPRELFLRFTQVALSGFGVRAIASVPAVFFRPFDDSFFTGGFVAFCVLSFAKPPPWIMKFGITRWKIVPS